MQVLEQVKSIANFTDQEVVSAQASIDNVLDSRTGQSIYGVYTLNLLFSLIYLTAGFMIISIVKTRRLQRQFSILRALGTPNPSIMRSVLADVCVSMFLGVLIGLMLGILMSLLVLQIPLAFLGFDTQISWSRLPVSMILPLPLLSSILFLSFLSAFVTTYAATKRGLSTNLADDFRLVE
jgi:ABC-type lipoprotein release transport system permease subunit